MCACVCEKLAVRGGRLVHIFHFVGHFCAVEWNRGLQTDGFVLAKQDVCLSSIPSRFVRIYLFIYCFHEEWNKHGSLKWISTSETSNNVGVEWKKHVKAFQIKEMSFLISFRVANSHEAKRTDVEIQNWREWSAKNKMAASVHRSGQGRSRRPDVESVGENTTYLSWKSLMPLHSSKFALNLHLWNLKLLSFVF